MGPGSRNKWKYFWTIRGVLLSIQYDPLSDDHKQILRRQNKKASDDSLDPGLCILVLLPNEIDVGLAVSQRSDR